MRSAACRISRRPRWRPRRRHRRRVRLRRRLQQRSRTRPRVRQRKPQSRIIRRARRRPTRHRGTSMHTRYRRDIPTRMRTGPPAAVSTSGSTSRANLRAGLACQRLSPPAAPQRRGAPRLRRATSIRSRFPRCLHPAPALSRTKVRRVKARRAPWTALAHRTSTRIGRKLRRSMRLRRTNMVPMPRQRFRADGGTGGVRQRASVTPRTPPPNRSRQPSQLTRRSCASHDRPEVFPSSMGADR